MAIKSKVKLKNFNYKYIKPMRANLFNKKQIVFLKVLIDIVYTFLSCLFFIHILNLKNRGDSGENEIELRARNLSSAIVGKSYFTNHLTMFMNNLNVQPPPPLDTDEGKTDDPPRTKSRNPSGTRTLCYCPVAG